MALINSHFWEILRLSPHPYSAFLHLFIGFKSFPSLNVSPNWICSVKIPLWLCDLCFSLSKGVASNFLPIYHYALTDYSRVVAEQIAEMNVELVGKTDLRFIESMYKVVGHGNGWFFRTWSSQMESEYCQCETLIPILLNGLYWN